MEILLMLIPLSVVLVFLIGAAFWWAVDHGQFDHFHDAANSIFRDDDQEFDRDQEDAAPVRR